MKSLLRKLSYDEILMLEKQGCSCGDWNDVFVSDAFSVGYISNVSFSGHVELGVFGGEILLPGGVRKHSGIRNAVLHNVTVGNDCVIENVNNYIANYSIGDNTVIINIDCMFTDGVAAFGNGVKVSVMDETGGREVMISDKLSAHQAYIMALYRQAESGREDEGTGALLFGKTCIGHRVCGAECEHSQCRLYPQCTHWRLCDGARSIEAVQRRYQQQCRRAGACGRWGYHG